MTDPRQRIETKNFSCEIDKDVRGRPGGTWVIGGTNFAGESGYAAWPEVVAFARAILAADESWLDAQTPTLEELRAKYPGAMVEITPLHIPGDDYLARLVTERESLEHAAPTVGHSLRWLAAKLEELTDE